MHLIQFLGLVLFISTSPEPGYEAILPAIPGDALTMRHDALILADANKSQFSDNWPHGVLKSADGKYWNYAELHGDIITFDEAAPPSKLLPPAFLIHINDDCCRMMGSVRSEYLRDPAPQAMARVKVSDGEAGWSKRCGRVDTIVTMRSSDGDNLVIHSYLNKEDRTLTLLKDGNAVIADFPKTYITDVIPDGAPSHFVHYYDMVTRGFLCSRIPSPTNACQPDLLNYTARETVPPPLRTVSTSCTEVVDIACSNSQYP